MRVLVDGVCDSERAGGISRYFTECITELSQIHPSLEFYVRLPRAIQGTPPAGKQVRQLRDWSLLRYTWSRAINARRYKRLRGDIYHSTYYTAPWRPMRSVATVYDFIHEEYASLLPTDTGFIKQKRAVIEAADQVVAISHATKEAVHRYTSVPDEKVTVTHLGVSKEFLVEGEPDEGARFRREVAGGSAYWLYVGSRQPYKNFGTLLKAYAQAAERSDAALVVVGGESRFLGGWEEQFIIENRLKNRVLRLPIVDDGVLRAAYKGASAFVYPSLQEGFGIPLLEAMASRCPIIASNIPVFREVAEGVARFVDPYDCQDIRDALLSTLEVTQCQTQRVEFGAAHVRTFTWAAAAEKLGEVYSRLA